MNTTILENNKRRCLLGLFNAKKDLYARRRGGYECVNGEFIIPKITDTIFVGRKDNVEPEKPIYEKIVFKWYEKLWSWILRKLHL